MAQAPTYHNESSNHWKGEAPPANVGHKPPLHPHPNFRSCSRTQRHLSGVGGEKGLLVPAGGRLEQALVTQADSRQSGPKDYDGSPTQRQAQEITGKF